MPELPEVETVARTLAPSVEGRSLVRVEVLNPKTWQGGMSAESICAAGPRPFAGTGRRGKVLLLSFVTEREEAGKDMATGLAFHLKMTGRLFAYPAGTLPGPHTRAVLHLDDGSLLFFDDARKFGYIRGMSPAELMNWPFWQKLGPEPLEIGADDFMALFQEKKEP